MNTTNTKPSPTDINALRTAIKAMVHNKPIPIYLDRYTGQEHEIPEPGDLVIETWSENMTAQKMPIRTGLVLGTRGEPGEEPYVFNVLWPENKISAFHVIWLKIIQRAGNNTK